ncbi:MAG: RNA methyltransferase [Ignavibacteriales bacterium]|nr:RNA methyltransferase [Ignavibacteriales bacterium]
MPPRKLKHEEIERFSLDEIRGIKKMPLYVLLSDIRSSYNVGSIFRTSDAAGISKLFLCGYTPSGDKKEVKKTALGSVESVEWESVGDSVELVTRLKKEGYTICALEIAEGSITYNQLQKINFPVCLIIGNEIFGVKEELMNLCDFAIEIPQHGIKQSINVAVAYGIAAFSFREFWEKS